MQIKTARDAPSRRENWQVWMAPSCRKRFDTSRHTRTSHAVAPRAGDGNVLAQTLTRECSRQRHSQCPGLRTTRVPLRKWPREGQLCPGTAAPAEAKRSWLLIRSVTRTHLKIIVLTGEQEEWRMVRGVQIPRKRSLVCDARDHRSVAWRRRA